MKTRNWYEDLFSRRTYIELYGPDDTELGKYEAAQIVNLLDLKPKISILDVCCGYGRHSLPLAEMGYKVTGLDLSELQIAEAKKRLKKITEKTKLQFEPNFIIGDAKEFQLNKKFDLVLNLFLSFGYDDHATNWHVLNNVTKHVKKNGLFFLDFWNKDKEVLEINKCPNQWEQVGDFTVVKEYSYDPSTGYITWTNKVFSIKGTREQWSHKVMAYSCPELIRMIESVGMDIVEIWGDYEGSQFSVDSQTLIIVARKSE